MRDILIIRGSKKLTNKLLYTIYGGVTMKTIPSSIYDRIEYNNKNSYVKIGFYDSDKTEFVEVARWRNSYNANSGANYGLLQIWSILVFLAMKPKEVITFVVVITSQ